MNRNRILQNIILASLLALFVGSAIAAIYFLPTHQFSDEQLDALYSGSEEANALWSDPSTSAFASGVYTEHGPGIDPNWVGRIPEEQIQMIRDDTQFFENSQ